MRVERAMPPPGDSRPPCRVRVIRRDPEFDSLEPEWQDLFGRSPTRSTPLRWEWMREWWRIYGPAYGDRRDGLCIELNPVIPAGGPSRGQHRHPHQLHPGRGFEQLAHAE